jgi:hypothetical protein
MNVSDKLCIASGDDGSYLIVVMDKSNGVDLDVLMSESFSSDEIESIHMHDFWAKEEDANVAEFGNDVKEVEWHELVEMVKDWD